MAFFATSDSFSLNSFSSMMLCSAMTPPLAVILNGVRDIQLLVHLAQLRDQRVHQLLSGAARQVDKAGDLGITPAASAFLALNLMTLGRYMALAAPWMMWPPEYAAPVLCAMACTDCP